MHYSAIAAVQPGNGTFRCLSEVRRSLGCTRCSTVLTSPHTIDRERRCVETTSDSKGMTNPFAVAGSLSRRSRRKRVFSSERHRSGWSVVSTCPRTASILTICGSQEDLASAQLSSIARMHIYRSRHRHPRLLHQPRRSQSRSQDDEATHSNEIAKRLIFRLYDSRTRTAMHRIPRSITSEVCIKESTRIIRIRIRWAIRITLGCSTRRTGDPDRSFGAVHRATLRDLPEIVRDPLFSKFRFFIADRFSQRLHRCCTLLYRHPRRTPSPTSRCSNHSLRSPFLPLDRLSSRTTDDIHLVHPPHGPKISPLSRIWKCRRLRPIRKAKGISFESKTRRNLRSE